MPNPSLKGFNSLYVAPHSSPLPASPFYSFGDIPPVAPPPVIFLPLLRDDAFFFIENLSLPGYDFQKGA
jgi:hypothetical protein